MELSRSPGRGCGVLDQPQHGRIFKQRRYIANAEAIRRRKNLKQGLALVFSLVVTMVAVGQTAETNADAAREELKQKALMMAQIPPPPATTTPAPGTGPRFLSGFTNRAVTPTAPAPDGTAAPGTTPPGGGPTPRSTPRVAPPIRRNSIVNPGADAGTPGSLVNPAINAATTTNAAPGEPPPITPSPYAITNASPEDLVPAGMIDWRGLPLDQVLLVYADLINKTVLRAATLPDVKITLTTKTALTKAEARQAIDVSLGMNGIGIIPMGEKFVKAVPLDKSGAFGGEFNKGSYTNLPFMGQYITHVIQLKYVKPSELVQVLQPYGSGVANNILPIDPSQILVLRDLTENVKRMLELIAAVDVAVESEFDSAVIPIKYAKATEIANALNSLSSGGGGGVSVGGGTGAGTRTTTRAGGGSYGTGSSAFGQSRFGTGTGTGAYGNPGTYPGGTFPGTTPTTPQASTTPGANPTFGDRLRSLMRGVTGNGEIVVLGQTKMIADERTNSLLIYASKSDLAIIRDIISKLDVVLAQVLIEGVIMEVNLNSGLDLGVSYLEKQPHGIGDYFSGRGAINNGNLLSNIANAATNGTPGGFSYVASLGNDLDVFIKASADASRAKIIQRPRIQTSHNEPALLFVGESRPYPTASYYGGGAYGGYSSIQQLQIGVTLEVTPLINPDGLVVMDIHQTIESANGSVNIVNVGDVPITSRKEASAKVSVKDRDTIILGGLIENSKTKSNSGVPFLKDVPMLGVLFRSSSETEIRNELIVLIRPTVLPTPEVAAQTARAEKAAMPLVRQMEKSFRADDAKRLHESDADHFYRDP